MQRKMTRTITVEYVLTDQPETEPGTRFDMLADCTLAEVIQKERDMPLADWVRDTDYMLIVDSIAELAEAEA
jgi:hypothetical protein